MKYPLIFFVPLFLIFNSCTKKPPLVPPPVPVVQGVDLAITYKVDNDIVVTNSFKYLTQSGYQYSLTTLVYYLSQLCLIKSDSSSIQLIDYQYVDALVPATNQMTFKDIPPGTYIGLKFNIGIDSLHNKSFSLAATTENMNMQWPDFMGGGYHIMKLEGNFKDSSGTYGYAMHIGTNACIIPLKIFKPIIVSSDTKTPLTLIMNINEWFRNPHKYDFNLDGNYIMGNLPLMRKISENGVDVFSF